MSNKNYPGNESFTITLTDLWYLNQALKGHAKSYDIELQDNLYPLNHFTKTKALVESHFNAFMYNQSKHKERKTY